MTSTPSIFGGLEDLPEVPTAGRRAVAEPASRARNAVIRHLGFQSTDSGRQYTMLVTEGMTARRFVLLIEHSAFALREIRFQDGPDVCSAKLRELLARDPDMVEGPDIHLVSNDFLDYRTAHAPGAASAGKSRPRP